MASDSSVAQGSGVSQYDNKFAQAIEQGKGVEYLRDHFLSTLGVEPSADQSLADGLDQALGNAGDQIKKMGSAAERQKALEILSQETAIPFYIRKWIAVTAGIHKDVSKIGKPLRWTLRAKERVISGQVDESVQKQSLGDGRNAQEVLDKALPPGLAQEDNARKVVQEIQDHPEKVVDPFLRAVEEIGTHENLKEHAKRLGAALPPPLNVGLALFVLSYHIRKMLKSVRRGRTADTAEIRKQAMTETFRSFQKAYDDTNFTLFSFARDIPYLGRAANYVLRSAGKYGISMVGKYSVNLIQKYFFDDFVETAAKISKEERSLKPQDRKLTPEIEGLVRSGLKRHGEELAQQLAIGADRGFGTTATAVLKALVVNVRLDRAKKAAKSVWEVGHAAVSSMGRQAFESVAGAGGPASGSQKGRGLGGWLLSGLYRSAANDHRAQGPANAKLRQGPGASRDRRLG